jgi:hypothetical protein
MVGTAESRAGLQAGGRLNRAVYLFTLLAGWCFRRFACTRLPSGSRASAYGDDHARDIEASIRGGRPGATLTACPPSIVPVSNSGAKSWAISLGTNPS